jgi:hypothetical protein
VHGGPSNAELFYLFDNPIKEAKMAAVLLMGTGWHCLKMVYLMDEVIYYKRD